MIIKTEGELALQTILETQEKPQAVGKDRKRLMIGLPKENPELEKRIALTPDAVSVLVKNGHQVLIEHDAGDSAHFFTDEYVAAGADVCLTAKEVFESHVVLKINPPTAEEIEWMQPESVLFSALHLTEQRKGYFEALTKKRITGIAFEFMQDKVGDLTVIRAMSEIAGSSAMMIASEYLGKGQCQLLGGVVGVPPTQVVIIGAGTVAEHAAKTALGLGADLKVFDTQLYRLQRLRYSLGQNIFTAILDSNTLGKALQEADVVVAAVRADNEYSPMVVSEDMVRNMKKNAVIIDVSIDQGGCVETSKMTSHRKPIFEKHGVIHYAVPNIASRVSHTASSSLSNIFTPMLLQAGALGGLDEMILTNQWFMKGVYTFRGNITHQYIAKKFELRYRDLRLLLAARI